jgi:hypothetical protein
MARISIGTLVLGLAAICATAATAPAAQPGTEPALKLTRIGTGAGSPKIEGNSVSFELILHSRRGVVGTAKLSCKRARPRCSIRSEFSEGRIVARGRFDPAGERVTTLAIDGGSGTFGDAEGVVKLSQYRDTAKTRVVYVLDRLG